MHSDISKANITIGKFLDLSHPLYDGMKGFKLKKNGNTVQYSFSVKPFLTRDESLAFFDGKCSFEVSEITFQTSIGTYLDSPYHRYEDLRDIGELEISELILPGIVIPIDASAGKCIGLDRIPKGVKFAGKAVLFCFGWDKYWGEEQYFEYPYLSEEVIGTLIKEGVKLVGVDTINVDDSKNLKRPAHSLLLARDIFIVENLTKLELLTGKEFTFFAVPIKAKGAAAMPVRAFAQVPG